MILIITSKSDIHVNSVLEYLSNKNMKCVRLNTNNFEKNIKVEITNNFESTSLFIKDSKTLINLNEISCVWYRKPVKSDLTYLKLNSIQVKLLENELDEFLLNLYFLLDNKIWINNPLDVKCQCLKSYQLIQAKKSGFIIPDTLISNDSKNVIEFAKRHNWNVSIKALSEIKVNGKVSNNRSMKYGFWNRKISKEELLGNKSSIKALPTTYQQYIDKEYELRITIIDKKIFACKIESQSSNFSVEDMRLNVPNIRLSSYSCSVELKTQLYNYLELTKLNFGCFDIAVTKQNDYVFFECNPNGQWLWVEEMTNLKISEGIANYLIKQAKQHTTSVLR